MIKQIRISEKAFAILTKMATESEMPQEQILDMAIHAYQTQMLMDGANKAYQALRNNPVAWVEHEKELALWDVTLTHGLEDE